MTQILKSPLFGIVLSIFAYEIGVWINKKTGWAAANPLLIAILLVVAVLSVFQIPLEAYQNGGNFISLFLAPATASLAISIYNQFSLLKKNLLPVLLGCAAGAVTSMGSVYLLCRLFRLDQRLTAALLPKSVTTPIAMELSAQGGGVPAFTVAAVIFTGILGAITAPLLVKLLRVKEPVEKGVAIGTCSHAIGTTKALEMGELEGAMSGISIGVAGIATVIICLFL